MKQKHFILCALALLVAISVAACAKTQQAVPQILTEPPALTVAAGGQQETACRGTYSWTYKNSDGTSTGFESDSLHMLQAKKYMPLLPASGTAELTFAVAPDEVRVQCWPLEAWDNLDATPEQAAVTRAGETFRILLAEEGAIYEITAKWSSTEDYGGTAYYGFYTGPAA